MVKTGSKPIDELVRLAIIGDDAAFTALWNTYIDSLKSYIMSKIKGLDEFQVEEICSWGFEKAFSHISDFDPSKGQFFTWLCTITRNVGLDILDREGKARPSGKVVRLDDREFASAAAEAIPDKAETVLDTIINNEDIEEKRSRIEALPDLYREVAKKRFIDEMPYKDIAEELGLELNTVRTRIRRAKKMIE